MTDRVEIRSSEDVVRVRQAVRAAAVAAGLSLVDQTKVVTAASELARNAWEYGGGGSAEIDTFASPAARCGVRLVIRDDGPGIADIDTALRDGYTSGKGLGLGLGGARRLSSEFAIDSAPGRGTRVTIARWK